MIGRWSRQYHQRVSINLTPIIARFHANTHVVAALCADADEEQARWRPAPEAWSLLEVIGHLLDEEREDFRKRLDLTLHAPHSEWPPIEPGAWVTARAYNARSLPDVLNAWLGEREASLAWLRGLYQPDWSITHTSLFGTMSAGDLLTAWLAHDHLHIRQLNELRYAWHAAHCAPYSPAYAGDW